METPPPAAHGSDETQRGLVRTWDALRQDPADGGRNQDCQSAPTCHCSKWAGVTAPEGHPAGNPLLIVVASL